MPRRRAGVGLLWRLVRKAVVGLSSGIPLQKQNEMWSSKSSILNRTVDFLAESREFLNQTF